jgi:ribonuclease P protein component
VGVFDALFRQARRQDGQYLQLLWLPAARKPGRAGFAIGTKALPRAVDRNRLRRLLRERLRRARPSIESCDVILRLKRGVARAHLPQVADEAGRLLATLSQALPRE